MKSKDLREILDKLPDDAELVISSPFLIDEKQEITGILDMPIIGVAVNDSDEKEIRFVLEYKDVVKCFKPNEVIKI